MATTSALPIALLFSLPSDSPQIFSFISSLSTAAGVSAPKPDIKSYPDAIYHNYYPLGVSLCFLPSTGLDSVDLYSRDPHPNTSSRVRGPVYDIAPEVVFRFSSTTLPLPPRDPKSEQPPQTIERPIELRLTTRTTGRDLVSCLGEPTKKGSGGWTGVWLEWTKVELSAGEEGAGGQEHIGMMVELRDPGAREMDEAMMKKGMGGVWDRASKWEWKTVKLYKA
ncbi:hypothetical protein B9479_003039 [Cryptococcus floricola]|uniref:Uncharacterized protein n=1 Tax=Cryptococcus floricola TaxID=2591691 RepID=A0A5D3AY04_9TREE|nr:hypothetical protein B9479_003039 [Cryptococcus floricola]